MGKTEYQVQIHLHKDNNNMNLTLCQVYNPETIKDDKKEGGLSPLFFFW